MSLHMALGERWPYAMDRVYDRVRHPSAFQVHREDAPTREFDRTGEILTRELVAKLVEKDHAKFLRADSNDVHDGSRTTTLPTARANVEAYVLEPVKPPWYIDLLKPNVTDLSVAEERIRRFLDAFGRDSIRVAHNLDFDSEK